MSKHVAFILSPLHGILEDASGILADGVGKMLSNKSAEYILYSTFLKMTGAQEQKLKCVCWEIATDNYEFRYKWQSGQFSPGECSSLDDKQKVLNILYKQISEKDSTFTFADSDRSIIINSAVLRVEKFFNTSMIKYTMNRTHQDEFRIWRSTFKELQNYPACILDVQPTNKNPFKIIIKRESYPQALKNALFVGWDDLFQLQYNHRNRCAHNTASYQETDMALFRNLGQVDLYRYNYLIFFTLLLIIDDITIKLFKNYLELYIDEY